MLGNSVEDQLCWSWSTLFKFTKKKWSVLEVFCSCIYKALMDSLKWHVAYIYWF